MVDCEKIRVEHVAGEKTAQTIVKGNFAAPHPGSCIEKIVSLDKIVRVTKITVVKNKVVVDGHLSVHVVYLTTLPQRVMHHINKRLGFTQFVEVPGAEPDQAAKVNVNVIDVQAGIDPAETGKFEIMAVLKFFVKVTGTEEINVMVTPPPGTLAELEMLRIEEVVSIGKARAVITKEIKVPAEMPGVAQVLEVDTAVDIKVKKILSGGMVCEGNIHLQVIYLTTQATQPVHNLRHTIHFTRFLEVPGVKPDLYVMVEEAAARVVSVSAGQQSLRAEMVLDSRVRVTMPRDLRIVTDIAGVGTETKLLRVEHVVGEKQVQVVLRKELETERPYAKQAVARVQKVDIPEEEMVIIRDRVILSGLLVARVLSTGAEPGQAVYNEDAAWKFRKYIPVVGAEPDQTVFVQYLVKQVEVRIQGSVLSLEVVLKLMVRVMETLHLDVVVCRSS